MSRRSARRARLIVKESKTKLGLPPCDRPHWLRLVAGNGKILLHTENYFDRSNAARAREYILDCMGQILEDERGWRRPLAPLEPVPDDVTGAAVPADRGGAIVSPHLRQNPETD